MRVSSRVRVASAAALAAILLSATFSVRAGASLYRVGAAVVDTSPSVLLGPDRTGDVCLGGFGIGCTRPATGEREPLYARAVVVESEGRKIAIASTSNIGLFVKYKPEIGDVGIYDIRRAAAMATGIPSSSILVVSDHSHSSPDVEGIWGGASHEYMRKLASATVRAIVAADERLESAGIVVGSAVTTDPLDNHWSGTGGVLDQVDREMRVLQARRPDGSVIATLANFAPHASILDEPDHRASGDWTGVSGNDWTTEFGGVGIATVGALGGIGPAREHEAGLQSFVQLVDGLAGAALSNARTIDASGVGAAQVFIREPLTAPILGLSLAPYTRDIVDPLEASIDRAVTPPWVTGSLVGTYVSALRIGDVFLGGAPGEAYPEISFRVSRDVTGAKEHFLFGLANDQLGYLVSPMEGVPTVAQNGAAYPVSGNDNFALSVSPTIGDHVACSLLDLARTLGFATATKDTRCTVLTAGDGVAPPPETP